MGTLLRSFGLLVWAPLLLGTACTPSETPDAGISCFFGDPAAAPEIEIVYHTNSGALEPVEDQGTVPLILPPQGGKVMLLGVRAKNLDGCPLTIATALIDPCTDQVIALERRPILMEPKDNGWLEPLLPVEISNFSNLPACPRANINRSINEQPYQLVLSVEDQQKRKVEKRLTVTPTCGEPENQAQCECECSASYALGGSCDALPDAGTVTTCDAGL